MSGRPATVSVIPGISALSIGMPDLPSPSGWAWIPLDVLARLESGHTPSREHPEYWDGGIPWIGIRDAREHDGGVINETIQTVSALGIENSAARILPKDTVCLSRTASIGYTVVMGKPMATSQDFVNWVCSEHLDPQFLQRLLRAELSSLRKFSKGSTHATIYYPEVKAFHVCLPPLNEQKRIVSKIDKVASASARARTALEQIPALIDHLRQSILAAAFRGDLTADWRARNPDVEPADKLIERIRAERRRRWEAAELARLTAKGKPPTDERWKDRYRSPHTLEDIDLPNIPAGWTWASAEESAHEVTVGYVGPMKDEYVPLGVPFLRSQNVRENRFDPREIKYISKAFHAQIAKSSLRGGDVAVVRSGAPGTACVVPEELGEANCSDLVIVRPLALIDSWFLSYFLNSSFARARVLDLQVGVAQQHFNVGAMKTLPLPIAPLEEQRLIASKIREAFASLERVDDRLNTLEKLRVNLDNEILAKAFRGEFVPHDPNDEPASVLLDRLRAEAAAAPAKPGRRARVSALADDDPSEPRPTAPRPRRVAATPAPDAPPTSATAPSPVVQFAPAPRAGQQPLPLAVPAVDFLELTAEAQAERVHAVLLGEGQLEREDAVRRVADRLRDAGLAAFQRLRRDGPLAACIDAAISAGLREGRFDRPTRGSIRAVAPEPANVPPPLWRRALLAALASPQSTDEAVRTAADWCRETLGLDFKRLRTGGNIDTALRSALTRLLAEGAVLQGRDGTLSSRTAI